MCFISGGTRFSEQYFDIDQSQMNSALLIVSAIAVLLPGAFDVSLNLINPEGRQLVPYYQLDVLHLSHGLSVVLVTST
jgi:Ca2+:H+ antiporter